MRKILAGLLATSMIVSMSTMMTAATYTAAGVSTTLADASQDITASNAQTIACADNDDIQGSWTADITVKSATIALTGGPSVKVDLGVKQTLTAPASTLASGNTDAAISYKDLKVDNAAIGKMMDGKSFPFSITVSGAVYTGKLTFTATAANVKFDQQVKLPSSITNITVALDVLADNTVCTTEYKDKTASDWTKVTGANLPTFANAGAWTTTTTAAAGSLNLGSGDELIENEKTGIFENLRVTDVIKSYGDGTPIPLTENKIGAGEDLNTEGGVQSGKTLYFMIRDDVVPRLSDDSYWKLKITKGDNGKYIDSVSDVTKIFNKDLYNANTGEIEPGTGADKARHRYIKVALKEIYTDDEYKINLDMTLRAQSAAIRAGIATDDSEIKIKDFSFYLKNIVKSADSDWTVGVKGLMLNPMLNDWNNVTYFDEENDVAFVRFFGDSDIKPFYAKLSTKWTHDDYAAYFNDQDAYYFEFTGSPKLSSTSRADLQIYNPFTDVDGNETIDPSTATIYQIVDGDLIDVTDSFTYGEGDNGENAFITRTRFLGSYIICEKPVDEAVSEEDIDDLMPDEEEMPVAPITPDNNAGGKNPANTGRYN